MKRTFSFLILAALALVAGAQGIVVGVIDMGFDYTHPAFRTDDGDGKLLISRVWEQGTDRNHPAAYDYGYEMTTREDILAACADDQTQSHGSHVAARALQFAGKQEGAELVLVSKGPARVDEKRLRDAINYIFDYAEEVGKPCVINMSLGSHSGPHDGTSAFDAFVNRTVGPGRIICASVGNNGISTGHLETSSEPLNTFIIFRSPDNTTGTVDIWGSPDMQYSVQLSAIQYENGNVSSQSEVLVAGLMTEGEDGKDYTWAPTTGRLKGTFKMHSEVDERNGKTHTQLSIDLTSAAMKYELALTITPLSEGTIHAWSDEITLTFHDHDREGFVKGDNRYSITELGGTADRIISVGAIKDDGSVADFCSRGPRLDGAVKPNVYAYGENIESALNSYDLYQSTYPYTQTLMQDGREYHMGKMSGTSMASPMVTGIVASWLRLHPLLTPEDAMALMDPNSCIDPNAGLQDAILAIRPDLPSPYSHDHTKPGKYLHQGRLVIIREGRIYNVMGHEILL